MEIGESIWSSDLFILFLLLSSFSIFSDTIFLRDNESDTLSFIGLLSKNEQWRFIRSFNRFPWAFLSNRSALIIYTTWNIFFTIKTWNNFTILENVERYKICWFKLYFENVQGYVICRYIEKLYTINFTKIFYSIWRKRWSLSTWNNYPSIFYRFVNTMSSHWSPCYRFHSNHSNVVTMHYFQHSWS